MYSINIVYNVTRTSMLDRRHQARSLVRLNLLAEHILHDLQHKMGTTVLDLSAKVARAHGNDDDAGRDASLDPARRIFEDDAARGTIAEAPGGEEERVRRGLPARRHGLSAVIVILGGTMPTERQPCTARSIIFLRSAQS